MSFVVWTNQPRPQRNVKECCNARNGVPRAISPRRTLSNRQRVIRWARTEEQCQINKQQGDGNNLAINEQQQNHANHSAMCAAYRRTNNTINNVSRNVRSSRMRVNVERLKQRYKRAVTGTCPAIKPSKRSNEYYCNQNNEYGIRSGPTVGK